MFEVTLDETLMFVKYNSIIPTFTRFNRVKEDYDRIIFKGYGKKATYRNYKDDYSTLNYKNGKFNVTTVKMNDKNVNISIQNNGVKSYESIDFIDVLRNLKLM